MATVSRNSGRPRTRELSPLGSRIHARMAKLAITVNELATASRVPKATIYRVLAGDAVVHKASTINKLSSALGTTSAKLVEGLF
jgi:transcriptional regulator with XRE-family HTH domain